MTKVYVRLEGAEEGEYLTDEETQEIIQGLRGIEKSSRIGFSKWIAKNLGVEEDDKVDEKTTRALRMFRMLVDLRGKFGDTEPVKVE